MYDLMIEWAIHKSAHSFLCKINWNNKGKYVNNVYILKKWKDNKINHDGEI